MDTCTPLAPGTILRTMSGTEFRLLAEHTAGGNAILYRAKQIGSQLDVTLKELCPPGSHRAGGVLVSSNAKDVLLQRKADKLLKERAAEEFDFGQSINNETLHALLTLGLLDIRSIQEPDGTVHQNADGTPLPCVFLYMPTLNKAKGFFLRELLEECAAFPHSEAHPLGNQQDTVEPEITTPDVLTCLRIIGLLLEALQSIHKTWLHGDISLDNLFVDGDLHSARPRGVFLLDFGSARPLDASGKTALLHAGDALYTTNVFSAPEINDFRQNGTPLQLTAAADVYSVGRLLRLLLNGEALCAMREGNAISLTLQMTDTDLYDLDVDRSARPFLNELNGILRAAAEKDPAQRISVNDMLTKINALISRLTAVRSPLMENLSSPEVFIPHSRDTELKELDEKIHSPERPIFLWGQGGLGKTETARAFLQQCKQKGLRVAFFSYEHSVRDTILNLKFTNFQMPSFFGMTPEQQEEALYQTKLGLLAEMGENSVIVMDNFDSYSRSFAELKQEPAYNDLAALAGPHLIITTRFQPSGLNAGIEIVPLKDDILLQMMQLYTHEPEATLRRIIRKVEGHTLICFLIAKTLRDSWCGLTADMVLEALEKHSLPELSDETDSDKDRRSATASIYGHLKTLYDISGMVGAYRSALCHAALLPQDGMDTQLFLQGETAKEKDALKELAAHGWVQRTLLSDNTSQLTIHSLIRELIINELRPEEADYSGFLNLLQKPGFFSITEPNASALRKLDLAQSVLSFPHFSATPELASICCTVGFHSFKRGRRREGVQYYNRGIAIYKSLSATDDRYLYQYASAIGSIGFLMSATAEYQKQSAELLRQAVAIWEQLSQAFPDKYLEEYATACDNLGYQLSLPHDALSHREAERFLRKALDIRFRLYQKQPEKYARVYAWSADNLGKVLTRDKDAFSEAEALLRTALSIRQKLNGGSDGKNISEIAWTCHNLGQLLATKPAYWTEAEQHYQTSIRLRQELDHLNPGTHAADASWTMLKLADLLALQPGRRTETKALYRKVLEIQTSIEKEHPGMFVLDISQIRRRYADYLRSLNPRTPEEESELTSLNS